LNSEIIAKEEVNLNVQKWVKQFLFGFEKSFFCVKNTFHDKLAFEGKNFSIGRYSIEGKIFSCFSRYLSQKERIKCKRG